MNKEKEIERLLSSRTIDPNTGCWSWTLGKQYTGYGVTWVDKKIYRVHRLSAHLFLDFPLDSKLSVLHRCDNTSCFNPEHLFIGTQEDNIHDSMKKGRYVGFKNGVSKINSEKTECLNGHPFDSVNTYVYKDGSRHCKTCSRARLRRYRARQ